MSDISREELAAFTEAHSKTAVALEKITGTLEIITQKQDKLVEKMTNGVTDSIVHGVVSNYESTHKGTIASLDRIENYTKEMKDALILRLPSLVEDKLKNSDMAKDIQHTKWFVGIVGAAIIVAMVIIRVIGTALNPNIVEDNSKVLQHMLEVHMQQVGEKQVIK